MPKIIYLVSHPIQYQAPLIKLFSRILRKKLEVIYLSDFSIGNFFEKSFYTKIKWDIDLLGKHKYLIINKNQHSECKYFKPFINFNLFKKIVKDKPEYVMIHGWANINFFIVMIICRLKGIKVLIRGENYIKQNIYVINFLKFIYYKIILYFPSYYLYIGTANKQFYKKYGWNRKYIHFGYAVDNKFLKVQSNKKINDKNIQNLNVDQKNINFYFVGKLIKRKNAILILKAINLIKFDLKNAFFYFIGDGIELDNLKSFCIKKSLKNIEFLGFQNTSEIPKIIKKMDVMICPSLQENWGLVVNETLTIGNMAIVSSAVKSSEDLINKNNGMIFKNNDEKELSKCILYFIKNKEKIKENKKDNIDKSFSFKSNIENIITLDKN